MKANRKIDQAFYRLMKWSEKPQWTDFVDQTYFNHLDFVLNDFDMTEDELFDCLGSDAMVLLNNTIYEDFFTFWHGDDNLNVIDDYLKRRGAREPQLVRQYFKALLNSSVSIYEVVDLDPEGKTLRVRDLLREDNMTLTIQKVPEFDNWVIWDCLGARVLSMNGKNYFSSGTLHLSRDSSKDLVKSIYSIAGKFEREVIKKFRATRGNTVEMPLISRDLFCAAVPISMMLTHAWLTEKVSAVIAPLPDIYNTHGEEIVICEVRFPILGDSDEVAAILDSIEEFERIEEEAKWDWHDLGSQHKGAKQSKRGLQVDTYSIDNTLLGFVEIRSESLMVTVNSAERADRGQMLLEARLGNLVGQPLTSYQDLKQLLKEPIDSKNKTAPIKDEKLSAIQDGFLKEHYSRTLDEPIPLLGNKIPRKFANTKKGRSEVIEWLKILENHEYRRAQLDGLEPFDMTWMWEELKIDVPR